ncbi:MAG: hypothetical protein RL434_3178 [Pseudomonadota bacterium]|jgi:predicted DNA-binding transcriptional regulator YafY
MDRTERFYRIQQLLELRGGLSGEELMASLEVSRATLHRDLEYLRDRLGMPINWDAAARVYRLAPGARHERRHALPGLWLSESELAALSTLSQLLGHIDPSGLIEEHLKPLSERLAGLLASSDPALRELGARMKIASIGVRQPSSDCFASMARAVFARRRVRMRYRARARDTIEEREVSPQRLVFYRQNWYLDGWCHLREGLRSFAMDSVEAMETLDIPALEVETEAMEDFFSGGYGIFNGQDIQWAVLRFSPERSRWVAVERWHSKQQGEFTSLGEYVLRVPYADDRELLGDILRHGSEVEVMSPPGLRAKVRDLHLEAGRRYPGGGTA